MDELQAPSANTVHLSPFADPVDRIRTLPYILDSTIIFKFMKENKIQNQKLKKELKKK